MLCMSVRWHLTLWVLKLLAKITCKIYSTWVQLLTTVLQERVALLNTPYDDNHSVQQPRGYGPMVIYNDYCSGQEEVGCKGRGHAMRQLRGSHAVSVLVVAL